MRKIFLISIFLSLFSLLLTKEIKEIYYVEAKIDKELDTAELVAKTDIGTVTASNEKDINALTDKWMSFGLFDYLKFNGGAAGSAGYAYICSSGGTNCSANVKELREVYYRYQNEK